MSEMQAISHTRLTALRSPLVRNFLLLILLASAAYGQNSEGIKNLKFEGRHGDGDELQPADDIAGVDDDGNPESQDPQNDANDATETLLIDHTGEEESAAEPIELDEQGVEIIDGFNKLLVVPQASCSL